MFKKILTKIVTKKLSKSYTKNFMKLEVRICLLFKFGFVKIFMKIFVRILKCIELAPSFICKPRGSLSESGDAQSSTRLGQTTSTRK